MGKKKRNTDDESGSDVGMVMTCSLFLIILTFFILLNSIAVIDDRKTRVAIGSLLGAFGSLPGGLSPMKTGDSIMPPSPPMIERDLSISNLMSIIDSRFTGNIRTVPVMYGKKIIIDAEALFTEDPLTLNPAMHPFLQKLCRYINQSDYAMEIAGHTDNVPGREKGFESNWELSARQALTVLKFFVDEGSVEAKRIKAYGCSSYHPVASNDTRRSRSLNRRIEIILEYSAPDFLKKIYQKKPYKFFTYKKFDFKIF